MITMDDSRQKVYVSARISVIKLLQLMTIVEAGSWVPSLLQNMGLSTGMNLQACSQSAILLTGIRNHTEKMSKILYYNKSEVK